MSWRALRAARPDLVEAALPLFLLTDGPAGLGYLATVRADGGPRVHPVSPVLLDGELYIHVLARTPKCADLHRDRRMALHSWPRPFEAGSFNDEEFFLRGVAVPVADADLHDRIAGATGDDPASGEPFRVEIERAMHKRRVGGLAYTVWRAEAASVAEP